MTTTEAETIMENGGEEDKESGSVVRIVEEAGTDGANTDGEVTTTRGETTEPQDNGGGNSRSTTKASADGMTGDTTSSSVRRRESTIQEVCYPRRVTSLRSRKHWFHPPRQRQRWGDQQVLPHVNWGDLFFDLFYVAAAYNLSAILVESPSPTGILYFVGCFGPIMDAWASRMYYDSRFAVDDDPVRRGLEVFQLCLLATAVLHIRPVSTMSNSSEEPDMFAFSLSVLGLCVLSALRYAEVVFVWVVGDVDAAKAASRRDLLGRAVPGIFYLAAAVVSGTDFYTSTTTAADAAASAGTHNNNNSNTTSSENLKRFLAGATGGDELETVGYYGVESTMTTSNVPIYLCLAGWLSSVVWLVVMVSFLLPRENHKAVSVPMNIDFAIHRHGEWVMLMLGESVLSLLIVDVPLDDNGANVQNYYVTFYAGVISVVLLQYLHFRSQPHRADDHAMRRSKEAGVVYTVLLQVYSFALVAIGVSYKMLLYEFTYDNDDNDDKHPNYNHESENGRLLAGGGVESLYSTEDRQQRVANIFCGSMAVAWLTLDLMTLSHRGIRMNAARCRCQHTNRVAFPCVVFASTRVVLVVFIATLCLYVNDPELLAVIGLAGIVAQVFLRVLGDLVLPKAETQVCRKTDAAGKPGQHPAPPDNEEDSEDGHWPNVTHAKSIPAASNLKQRLSEQE